MNPMPSWDTLTADANTRRQQLWHHVREWAARHHASTRNRSTPGRVLAALDATARPPRSRLVALHDATQHEVAEAAANDLWDATAVVWAMVKHAPEHAHGLHHVVAELQAAGRWLAAFPVHTAQHERALAELFEPVEAVD
jgi:hypothetical protein